MGKKLKTPSGLDYQPVTGEVQNLSYGVAQAKLENGGSMTAEQFAFKRLFPVDRPADMTKAWPRPTCYRWDVLLPPGAGDDFIDPQRLFRSYDEQCFGTFRDLAIIITMRFPDIDTDAAARLHEAWEDYRGFIRELVNKQRLAALMVCQHGRGCRISTPFCRPGSVSRPQPSVPSRWSW